jgi:histidinol phosphatase-like enzyme
MVTASATPKCRAIFLDRDGVLVIPVMRDGRSYAPRKLDDFQLYPEAKDALTRLRDAGYLLVVVTNQPDAENSVLIESKCARTRKLTNVRAGSRSRACC